MPPIMGAVAFIMSDVTGIPYLEICLAALIPAIFYYVSLFAFISAQAKKSGLSAATSTSSSPLNTAEKLNSLPFIIPLGMIVILMVNGSSPALAGGWALIMAIFIGFLVQPSILKQPHKLWQIVVNGAKSCAIITIAVAAVGIIIAVMNNTGLGLQFAQAIENIAAGNLLLSLILMALGCLVLGMGMPTVPAYLIIILVMGPAVEALGVETIAAHLFVVYYAVLSAVTPPVALAAFAAAPIAQANPLSVSVTSLRLAIIGFIIPFAFIFHPSLLLVNQHFELIELFIALFFTSLSVRLIYASFECDTAIRWLYAAAGIISIYPNQWCQLLAIATAIFVTFSEHQRKRTLNKHYT